MSEALWEESPAAEAGTCTSGSLAPGGARHARASQGAGAAGGLVPLEAAAGGPAGVGFPGAGASGAGAGARASVGWPAADPSPNPNRAGVGAKPLKLPARGWAGLVAGRARLQPSPSMFEELGDDLA